MKKNIDTFIKNFKQIKSKEFNKALRNGYTGIGFTYETLIGKKEDNSFNPDVDGIEIKTKLGYSKSNMTLFTLAPQSEKNIKYIYDKYAYSRYYNQINKTFRFDIFANRNIPIQNIYIMRLKVNRIKQRLELIILDSSYQEIDSEIYWNFNFLKERLEIKLNTLAIIKGYPYKKGGEKAYKYTNLSIYKLRSFDIFLKLIEENKIYITFNIGTHMDESKFGQIYDRGTAFKIKNEYIDELFIKIY